MRTCRWVDRWKEVPWDVPVRFVTSSGSTLCKRSDIVLRKNSPGLVGTNFLNLRRSEK